jgi:GT2 family glycosyltransferase
MAEETPPLVTVVVRTKDRPAFLKEAVASLRAQTSQDFETLVVNDGGASPRPEGLLPHPGRGLRILETAPPHGRARALNTGVGAARGRFVAFLDDDDLWRPEHVETLARFLSQPHGYRAAYTDAERVLYTLGDDGVYRETRALPLESRDTVPERLLYRNHVPLICLMAERSALLEAGPFDETFDLYEDWEHLIRLAKVARIHHIRRTTAVYRTRDDGTNATTASPWLGARSQEARARVYEMHWTDRSPATEIALMDGLDLEVRTLEARLAALEAEAAALRPAVEGARQRAEAAEGDLARFRADAARQLQAAGEREAAFAADRDRLAGLVTQMQRSLVWRLFTPYWKLKALLSR